MSVANTLFENLRRNFTSFVARLENKMAVRALPSPSSSCVRTAMADDAIANSLSHGLSRGPTLAAPFITIAGDQGVRGWENLLNSSFPPSYFTHKTFQFTRNNEMQVNKKNIIYMK